MEGLVFVVFTFLLLTVLFILVMRWLGAWMLRINEVIEQLQKINSKLENTSSSLPQKDLT